MTGSAEAVPSTDPEQLRWLRVARVAAFCSLLFVLFTLIVVAFLEAQENGTENLSLTLWSVPLWLPYLWMYLQMKSKSTKRRKKGLALAVVYGAWALLLAGTGALGSTGAALQSGFALFAVFQLALVVFARRTYKAMEEEPGDWRILATRLVITSACFATLCLAAIFIPNSYRARISSNEARAIAAMRDIRTAQSNYAERNPQKGFASELSELGPSGANLIDQDLAQGSKTGYSFRLITGPSDASGRTQYILLARPIAYKQTGQRSFFTDASGTIRFTAEDRTPTAQDPPLD